MVLCSVAIFLAFFMQKNLNYASSEKFAFLIFCFVFGPAANIVGAYYTDKLGLTLILVSSICYVVSVFLLFSKTQTNWKINVGKFILVTSASLTFINTLLDKNNYVLKVPQIFSYLSLYFVWVFDPLS